MFTFCPDHTYRPAVTSPVTKVAGSMVVPPPWYSPTTDGACTAELRTTPFDAASDVTLDALRGDERWTVSQTELGPGAVQGDSCAFTVTLDVPTDKTPDAYRLTVESSTKSLLVTWDYPAAVVRSGEPLAMPLTDKILTY